MPQSFRIKTSVSDIFAPPGHGVFVPFRIWFLLLQTILCTPPEYDVCLLKAILFFLSFCPFRLWFLPLQTIHFTPPGYGVCPLKAMVVLLPFRIRFLLLQTVLFTPPEYDVCLLKAILFFLFFCPFRLWFLPLQTILFTPPGYGVCPLKAMVVFVPFRIRFLLLQTVLFTPPGYDVCPLKAMFLFCFVFALSGYNYGNGNAYCRVHVAFSSAMDDTYIGCMLLALYWPLSKGRRWAGDQHGADGSPVAAYRPLTV